MDFTYMIGDIETTNRLQNTAQNNQLEFHFEIKFPSVTQRAEHFQSHTLCVQSESEYCSTIV